MKLNFKSWKLLYVLSILLNLLVFFTIVLRLFYPHTKTLAIIFLTISCIVSVYSFKNKFIDKHKKFKKKSLKFLITYKHQLITLLFLIIVGSVAISYFGVFKEDFLLNNADDLRENLNIDKNVLLYEIKNFDKLANLIVSLNLSEENFDSQTKEHLLELWNKYLNYVISIDMYKESYRNYYKINYFNYPIENLEAFVLFFASYNALYKNNFIIVEHLKNYPDVEIFLNENGPKYNSEESAYLKIKSMVYLEKTPAIAIMNINHAKIYKKQILKIKDSEISSLYYYGVEVHNFLKNFIGDWLIAYSNKKFDDYQNVNMEMWFPVQKNIANTMGNVKFKRQDIYLITINQTHDMTHELEPGDILLERRNWYASNMGIPGFWTHAALYIGSIDEADEYFINQKDLLNGKSLKEYLSEEMPELYLDYSSVVNDKGYEYRTIEAIAPGVVFLPIEKSGKADSIVALRPRLSKENKLKAVLRAFSFYHRPYDYDFDFATDNALVCSELVYKSYLPDLNKDGLSFDTELTLGRKMLSPVDIAKSFDLNYNTSNMELDFVFFYDAVESEGISVRRGVEIFRTSWQKSKWDFFQ